MLDELVHRAPALTISMTRRGLLSRPAISSMECAPMTLVPLARCEKVIDLGDGAIEGDDGKTVVVHIEDQVLAHDGQPNQGDVSCWFHVVICCCLKDSTIQRISSSASKMWGPALVQLR